MSGGFKPAWVRKQQLAWEDELSEDDTSDGGEDVHEDSTPGHGERLNSSVCEALQRCLSAVARSKSDATPFKSKQDALRTSFGLADVRSLDPDETLCAQGEAHRSLFFVLSGQLVVTIDNIKGDRKPVAKIRSGELLGELSFFLGSSSKVTVRASGANQSFGKRGISPSADNDFVTTCTVAVLHHDRAMELLQTHPHEMGQLFHAVCDNIMDRTATVSAELGLGTNLHRHLIGLEGEQADDRTVQDVVRQFGLREEGGEGEQPEHELTAIVRCKIALDGQADPCAGSIFLLTSHLCIEQPGLCLIPSRRTFQVRNVIGVLGVNLDRRAAPGEALDAISVQLKTDAGVEAVTLLMQSAVLSEFAVCAASLRNSSPPYPLLSQRDHPLPMPPYPLLSQRYHPSAHAHACSLRLGSACWSELACEPSRHHQQRPTNARLATTPLSP